MADFTCIVVTPEATLLEEKAKFVAVPLHDGEKGIGRNHAPLIARLGCGELRLTTMSGDKKHFYVDGGFVQVNDNTVTVMTDRALPSSSLNEAAARDLLETSRRSKAASEEQISARERVVNQARAQIRIAQRAKK